MADYFLAPALVQLREEVNDKFPERDTASDGWIGDPSHAARVSDHNPCWSCSGRSDGIVRAIDVDSNGKPGERTPVVDTVLAAAIGDPRVWYVIWDRVIYSRTYAFAPRAYTGSNPHDHHVHVSLNDHDTLVRVLRLDGGPDQPACRARHAPAGAGGGPGSSRR